MTLLRDYQEDAIKEAQRHLYERNLGGTIIHFATGLGKTRTAAEFIARHYDLHKQRVMFVVHTIDLVIQTYYAFLEAHPEWEKRCYTRFGYPGIGMVMGKYDQQDSRIVIGTPQTLSGTESSSERLEEVLKYGMFDLIIIDEAHYGASQSYLNLCVALLPAKRLGLTATPMRNDGLALRQPLGKTGQVLFDTICISRNIKWGIANGYLCPILPPLLVETNITLPEGRGGIEERAKLIDTNNWAELVVDAYEKHGEERMAVFYLPSVEHSRRVREEFHERGYRAVHVEADELILPDGTEYTGQRSRDMRSTAWEMGLSGDVDIYCNYGVLTHGWDMPPIALIGHARPTDSAPLVAQMFGRGTRLHDSKTDLKILDYTLKNIPLMLSGTLLGYTWDEKRQEMVADPEAEVEELSDGLDLRDIKAEDTLVDGNGIIVRVGRLFKSMSQAWHNEGEVMTLGLSKNDMLLIHLPNYTQANRISEGMQRGQDFLMQNPNHEDGQTFYRNLMAAHRMTSHYTLWHIHREHDKAPYEVRFVADAESAELVFDYALPVIEQYEDPGIAKKRSPWRRQAPSTSQLQELRRYGILNFVGTKGDASKVIAHNVALQNVKRMYNFLLKKAGKYGIGS